MATNRSAKGQRGSFPNAKRRATPKTNTSTGTRRSSSLPKGAKRDIPDRLPTGS